MCRYRAFISSPCAPTDNASSTGMKKRSPISVASSTKPVEALPQTLWSALLTPALLRLLLQPSAWALMPSAPSWLARAAKVVPSHLPLHPRSSSSNPLLTRCLSHLQGSRAPLLLPHRHRSNSSLLFSRSTLRGQLQAASRPNRLPVPPVPALVSVVSGARLMLGVLLRLRSTRPFRTRALEALASLLKSAPTRLQTTPVWLTLTSLPPPPTRSEILMSSVFLRSTRRLETIGL